jgi:hypothetical protein
VERKRKDQGTYSGNLIEEKSEKERLQGCLDAIQRFVDFLNPEKQYKFYERPGRPVCGIRLRLQRRDLMDDRNKIERKLRKAKKDQADSVPDLLSKRNQIKLKIDQTEKTLTGIGQDPRQPFDQNRSFSVLDLIFRPRKRGRPWGDLAKDVIRLSEDEDPEMTVSEIESNLPPKHKADYAKKQLSDSFPELQDRIRKVVTRRKRARQRPQNQ